LIGSIGSGLQGREVGSRAGEPHVGIDLALKQLAHQHDCARVHVMRHHVTYRNGTEGCRELGQKIADLVRVRQQHIFRLHLRQ
jgi:hypothetical protein